MSKHDVFRNADRQAEQQQATCQRWFLASNPMSAIVIKTNYKFFRRMAGLRGSDLKVSK